ncbi:dTDP-4-dehydrorhamnose reductase [Eikenella sp. S3360]|uniref:dTDP-4-dehydrorhamnose reductase n=1 Tax=Eikenella glucosivorans TaxID=2766967 RepID=A0ABS0N8E0_9NEIS|nr:dTDP-4-dehydrorhamnose reductase [Eikenella glucosivorans]MBH5328573.1 dTDP-4-dehydrorhamnose reductase [Eikenella glucosivorans]
MKLLITGHQGQVGQSLVQQAAARHFQIAAYDRSQLDIADPAAVWQAVEREQPAVIINAAAYTAVDKAESEPAAAHAANAAGPANLAHAAQRSGAALLHISTDYVFDGRTSRPYRETDTPHPQTVYGQSKLAGEQAVQAACPRHIILRTAWVFGEHCGNFVKTMLRLGHERDSLGIVADQAGAPTYAGHIAAALLHLAERTQSANCPYGLYHFSGSPHTTWHGFAAEIFRRATEQGILPRAPELHAIATADYPTPARRPADSRLDCGKIHSAFGIPPSDWQSALNNLASYL